MILVVEDDAEVREVICEILVEQGYGVVCAENGALALERVRGARPDLILLDLRMPVMGGAEFLGRLRGLDEGSAVPVVIMSASPNPAAEVGALSFQACLKKPFGMSELLVLVDRLVEKR